MGKNLSKFSRTSFRMIVILLTFSILITGCHSYYTIPKDDYNKISTMKEIKIVYTNGKEFIVENNDTTNTKIVGDSVVIHKGTEKDIINMNEISKIKESKFDSSGTIAISLVGLSILIVLFFSLDPFKT